MLIRGTVTDAVGAPIEWATVWFASGDHPTPDIAAVTDAMGRFTITAPAPGTYVLGSSAEGHRAVEVTVDVTDGDIEVNITLPTAPTA